MIDQRIRWMNTFYYGNRNTSTPHPNRNMHNKRSSTRIKSTLLMLVALVFLSFFMVMMYHYRLPTTADPDIAKFLHVAHKSLSNAINSSNRTDFEIAFELAKLRLKQRLMLVSTSVLNNEPNEKQKKQNDDLPTWMATRKENLPKNLEELKKIILSTIATTTTTTFWYDETPFLLNSIRIPKSASSSLSMIARALVGCKPDGYPCCKGRGSPPGSCPRPDLFCPLVRGCVNHIPSYPTTTVSLLGDDKKDVTTDGVPVEPIITYLRHPNDRLLSSFFYHPPHRPKHRCFTFSCFQSYVKNTMYQNILTKMMYGIYAYNSLPSDIPPSEIVQHAKKRLCNPRTWFGFVDMEVASQLLLYETPPFSYLDPNPVVFSLPAATTSGEAADTKEVVTATSSSKRKGSSTELMTGDNNTAKDFLRINENDLYHQFKLEWGERNEFIDLVESHNSLDYDLYQFAVHLFCARLEESGLFPLSKFFKVNPFEKCELPRPQPQQDGASSSTPTSSVQDLCSPFLKEV